MFSTGLLAIDTETCRQHNKIVTTAFQNNILDKFLNSFSKYSCILSDSLNDIHEGEFHNICMFFSQCTLDVICDTVFGYKLNAQANDDTEIVDSIQSIVDHTVQHMLRPWLHFDRVHNLTKRCARYRAGIDHLKTIIQDNISSRREQHKEMTNSEQDIGIQTFKNTLLIDILILNNELSAHDIVGETSSIANTGTKTTSITCCFVLALLCEHQYIQDSVLEEQKRMFWEDFQRPVTTEDLPRKTYLEQVIS